MGVWGGACRATADVFEAKQSVFGRGRSTFTQQVVKRRRWVSRDAGAGSKQWLQRARSLQVAGVSTSGRVVVREGKLSVSRLATVHSSRGWDGKSCGWT